MKERAKNDGRTEIVLDEQPDGTEKLLEQVRLETTAGEALALERASTSRGMPGGRVVLVECVDAHHPTLQGRVRVRMPEGESWVPTLQGMTVRAGDRLLLTWPEGSPEPIATGVLDGMPRRPEPASTEKERLRLERDEVLVVESSDGTPVVELRAEQGSIKLRLLAENASWEAAGELRLSARSLVLSAREGDVKIEASDDVLVQGEMIRLN